MTDEPRAPLADVELREREEQYRSIFEGTTDGLVISDMEGYVVEANPAFCRISGYSRDVLIGMHGTALTHPDSLYTVEQSLRAIREGGELHYQGLGLRNDGSVCPAEVHAGTFTYKGQRHMLAVVRDITDRVRAEQELRKQAEQLREREEQYRSIFESSLNAILIADRDGFIVEANPAACTRYGYTHNELVGLHGTALVHPDFRDVIEESWQTIRAGTPFSRQVIAVRKDGSHFYSEGRAVGFMYRGEPHVLSVGEDITERVKVQELLEQRVEERTRELTGLLEVSRRVGSMLELDPLLSLVLDELKTVIDYGAAGILMVEGDMVQVLDFRGPVPHPHLRTPVPASGWPEWEQVQRGQTVIVDDRRNAEAPFLLRSYLAAPMTVRDRVIGALSVSHASRGYFTEHHASLLQSFANQAAVAIENARLYEKAQELAALEERQRLARELHDSVTQALYGIGLAAETTRLLLEQDPARAGQANATVQTLAKAGMTEMRALLFELRPESLEWEGLTAALQKQANALEARYTIPVETTLCAEPATSLPVKEALYRIAQEALHNAIKHAQPTRMEVRLECATGGILLEVRDDGRGFDPGGSFPGHLGLHTMRERATKLGGAVNIESAPGKGTRVRARMPSANRP